jgi:hypothetical protein
MYRGKQRGQTAPVQVEEQYSDVDEEINEEVIENVAAIEGEASIPRHVSQDSFKGRKSALLNISFTGTPEEFAQNKTKCEWRLASNVPRHLKHNLADVNRNVASDDNLHGSLKRVVPLDFEVVAHRNSAPSEYGIDIEGLMPQVISSHGACLWAVPADTPYTKVNEKVFEPTNFIDEHIMETMQVCTFDDLKEDIQVKAAGKGKPGYGTVAVGTLAHAQLIESMNSGRWDAEPLDEEHRLHIYDPPAHRRTIEVTPRIAIELKQELEGPLRDLEKRCMNLEDLVVRLSRQDGIAHFNSPEGLHGELVGSDIDPTHKLGSDRLNQICNVTVLARLTYAALP